MKLNRRNFLKAVGAGTCGSIIHGVTRPANSFMAYALPPVIGSLGSNPIMLVVNLAGGADHNLSPIYDGWYMDGNPDIAYTPQSSIPLVGSQGLHPALTYFKTLWDANSMAIVNLAGIGVNGMGQYYRAHDRDTVVKLTGDPSGGSAYGGWPSRLTSQISAALGGVSFSGESLVVQGDTNPPRAVGDLENFGEDSLFWGSFDVQFRATRDNLIHSADAAKGAKQAAIHDSIIKVENLTKTLAEKTNVTLPVTFPNTGLGRNFQDMAKIVNANLGTQFFFAEQGGYDTHSGAKDSVTNLLSEVNGAVSALVECAKVQGWWSRLVVLFMTEFGRTWQQNSSMGNDHGFAYPMFVMGGGIQGGRLIGSTPTFADTGGTTYFKTYHTDYRQIFKEAITAMGYNSNSVFQQPISYTSTGLFA